MLHFQGYGLLLHQQLHVNIFIPYPLLPPLVHAHLHCRAASRALQVYAHGICCLAHFFQFLVPGLARCLQLFIGLFHGQKHRDALNRAGKVLQHLFILQKHVQLLFLLFGACHVSAHCHEVDALLQRVDVCIDLVPVLLEKNFGVFLRYPLVVGGRCFEGVVLGLGLGAICERSGRRGHALRFIILDLAVVAQPLGFEVVGRPLVAQAVGLAVLGLRGEVLEVVGERRRGGGDAARLEVGPHLRGRQGGKEQRFVLLLLSPPSPLPFT